MSDLSQFDYELPREYIAQFPLPRRSDARLLVADRANARIEHRSIRDLPDILRSCDCLVINDTRVVAARLVGRRTLTGGRWEGLYLEHDERGVWRLLFKTRGKLAPGETVTLANTQGHDDVRLELLEKQAGGVWMARAQSDEQALDILERVGRVPLPPYIRGGVMVDDDRQRYQTVYARQPGSAAAPTAGLHFTEPLLARLFDRGITPVRVTLHVGLDTFRPIAESTLAEHTMHSEFCRIEAGAVEQIRAARAAGGRVVAVGTTTVRVLETASQSGELQPWSGRTTLFIRPPYVFRSVDVLLTNFHLPRTTLLVLVQAFGGRDLVMRAYAEAIREKYRFYSYGDAMLIM